MTKNKIKYPGVRLTSNGNQLVSYHVEARIAEVGVFYPITPSTEMGELFQLSFSNGELSVFGKNKIAIETEGEHAAQGGAIAASLTGFRSVNFTSGQGLLYGLEQYYPAPGKMSSMVVEIGARALTKASLNVHCGHDDIYAALDTGWIMLFAKDAQQAADQAIILRRVTEQSLTPGMNIQDGFLTTHLERTFLKPESALLREYLGSPDDIIPTPTPAQVELFGKTRRRIPKLYNLENPVLLGTVQNQEHYMNSVVSRKKNFVEPILDMLRDAYKEYAALTGREYGLISTYNCEKADTVFVALGSAVENIEAAVDYIRKTKQEEVGVIHINVIRPFPELEIVEALRGKKNVIVLERIDDQLAKANPLERDIRTTLGQALEGRASLPTLTKEEIPTIYSGVYGLGSRDFRPESILGAYEYVRGQINRQDGKSVSDKERFFYLGVNHPYNVVSKDKPSLLPEKAIAVRFHSIGGWGAITTGKNLSEIIGALSSNIAEKRNLKDEVGNMKEVLHVSANPKYGSEKKGAPTNYFLVAAPERIRVNCDLDHVDVVLCCDPKAFTYSNPVSGMSEGSILVIESDSTDSKEIWSRIPKKYRQELIDKKIRVCAIPGFAIAKKATPREDLQFRMQGNSFLGAFFKVISLLDDYNISSDEFIDIVLKQYEKKFGRFGSAVVEANLKVMKAGFEQVWDVELGEVDAADRSSMRGEIVAPASGATRFDSQDHQKKENFFSNAYFNAEFKSDYGYFQPCSPLASTGISSAATGAEVSKYVARKNVPIFHAENCTQCMNCISVCPDTALPNTAQDLITILETAAKHYIQDSNLRDKWLSKMPELEVKLRAAMLDVIAQKQTPAPTLDVLAANLLDSCLSDLTADANYASAKESFLTILAKAPLAYGKVRAIFEQKEKQEAGTGGIFSIFVSDLCKGCGECVIACGDKKALSMVAETEELNADLLTATRFLDLLPETGSKYLGKYDANQIQEVRAAVLQNHLMVRKNYDALVSGDGACAGCGEKTILRTISSITEATMRPIYHAKADRLNKAASALETQGASLLSSLQSKDKESYAIWRKLILHTLCGFGCDTEAETESLIANATEKTDKELIDTLVHRLKSEAFKHKNLQAVEKRYSNGMSVMAMTASTGCNTVYGSTTPNNPHSYPWINSLFQDGATLGWLMGESMILRQLHDSVVPERLANLLLEGKQKLTSKDFFLYTHFTDAYMTEQEIQELPKIWAVGGDGAFGDIGYQNVSKVMLQNRPNVHILMLDTQVYSNTGGQNSDSSFMPGGFDMNQAGAATEGKFTARKEVAMTFISGHGAPLVANVSIANSANLYKTIIDGLLFRGSFFLQAYTTCQPEHGVADSMAASHAKLARDSRAMPEFVFNPTNGDLLSENLLLKGNPDLSRDWMQKTIPGTKEKYNYTVAHWATKEARFRKHFFKVAPGEEKNLIHLDAMLAKLSNKDFINRSFLDENSDAFIPSKGVYIMVEKGDTMVPQGLSRQMVLFVLERRTNWRKIQGMATIENKDYITT